MKITTIGIDLAKLFNYRVIRQAYSTGNGLLGGGPKYGKMVVGSGFTAQLNCLSNLYEKEALSEARIWYAPNMWGP